MLTSEIAAFACAKIRIEDADTLAQALKFTRFRWANLWDDSDWRQARHAQTVAVAAGVQDVTLDADFGLVQACRWGADIELPVLSERSQLAADPAAQERSGTPAGFIVLPKEAGICRVRLVPIPQVDGDLLVLGKRKCPTLADGDEPPLPGASEALAAFVEGDLWRSIFRQFSKAQACYEEANALLARMRDLENRQSQQGWRLVPICEPMGGGDDWGLSKS